MKRLAAALILLLAAVGVGLVARDDPGYVVIGYGPWTVETTLALVIVALLTGFLVLYYLIRVTANAWLVPRRMRAWSQLAATVPVQKARPHSGSYSLRF